MRTWLVLALLVYPFASQGERSVHFGWKSPWIEEVGILVAIVIANLVGRLSKEEKAKRRVLGMATGLMLPPRHFGPITIATRRDTLEETVQRGGLPVADSIACLAALPSFQDALVPVYAYAVYSAATDRSWAPVVEAVWPRVAAQVRLVPHRSQRLAARLIQEPRAGRLGLSASDRRRWLHRSGWDTTTRQGRAVAA